MRRIGCNREAVSNVLGYLISFMVAASVMTSSVLITTNIIDDKTTSVAEVEAQSLANKVADALVEAVESKQSMPEASYQKTLDIPMDLAGKSYYIETTSTKVYVNTTDGAVSKSSTTYGAEDLNIGISGRVYGGSSELDLLSNKSDFAYKLDFGTGDSTNHSPVESGYCMVSNRSSATQSLREPIWWNPNYQYRIPIKVKNDASEELDEVPVKIVLDTTNFDYSNANVNVTSSSTVSSDLVFIDSEYGIVAEVEISPDTWYTWWLRDCLVGDIEINVTITELSEGYSLDNIDGDSIKLNGVSCERWDGSVATFDPQEALLSLGVGGEYATSPTPGEYTITISGSLNDWTPFYGGDVVTVAIADILVDDDADPSWYDATHVKTVQEGIDNASYGDTVFVYVGTYDENIVIDKTVNLFGEAKTGTIVDGGGSGHVVTVNPGNNNVYIDSFTVRDGGENGIYINGGGVGDTITGITIRNCVAHGHRYNGIHFRRAIDSTIINCEAYNNGIGTAEDGIRFWNSSHNTIINCSSHDNSESHQGSEYSDGIDLKGNSDHNVVENCTLYGNSDDGIDLDVGADDNIIRNSTCYDNKRGILIDGGTGGYSVDNIIEYCDIYDNSDDGINIYLTDSNTIRYTNCYDNKIGIGLYGGVWANDYNAIEYCNCYDNADYGIYLYLSGELITGEKNWINNSNCYNTVGSNKQDVGIFLEGSFSNEIEYCNFYNNNEDGARLDDSRSNIITRCNMFDNDEDGLHLEDASSLNAIGLCNFYDNGDDGLHLEGGLLGDSDSCYIQDNNFYCNQEAGLYIHSDCNVNDIQRNNFAENGLYNAYDECTALLTRNWWDQNYYDDLNSNPKYPDYEIPPYGPLLRPTIDENPNTGFGPDGRHLNPDVIIVEGTGSASWPPPHYHVQTIQEGVTNVIAGGTVYVKQAHNSWGDPATYSGDITISKKLNLIGEDRETVIIDGQGNKNIVVIAANKVKIESLTIKNCKPTGIYIWHSPEVSITNCEIYSDIADAGHGIQIVGSSSYDNIITNCDVHDNDYGIYIRLDAYDNTITNCIIHDNEDGILFDSSDSNIITDCVIYANIQSGIYITDDSDGNDVTNCDIYDNKKDGVSISTSTSNEITKCNIRDNWEHGIQIKTSSDSNEIKYCTIEGNTKDGIRITSNSDSNEIKYCTIEGNTKDGIRITSNSDSNEIKYCDIYSNDDGINITGSSLQNGIENCNIYSNTQHGIYISGSSNNNRIVDRNNIRDNDYGIYISGPSGNEIHHNNFENNNYSAHDTGSNTWDNDYISTLSGGGNHWDNYDESYEGAYDFYSGPNHPQNGSGSDGIVDTPYNIPGKTPPNQDKYPFGGGKHEVRPYYIDYWNPYGQSIILVNMSLKSHAFKYIYLYYGYDEPLDDFHDHSISEISVFSDDFNDNLDKWEYSPAGISIAGGSVTIDDSSYICTKDYEIPENRDPQPIAYSKTTNESMYIAEARMKINEGQGNMFFLNNPLFAPSDYTQCYLVSADVNPVSNFTLHKNKFGYTEELLDFDSSVPDLNHWLRMKSYVYLSKSCYMPDDDESNKNTENITIITGFLYNYDTFADEGNVSGWDIESIVVAPGDPLNPWMRGEIGLGAGLLPSQNSNTEVDWVRVMKTPIVPPTISIGSMESSTSNYGWTTPPSSENRETFDPFNPGPVLCDFNYGTTPATFVVNLPEDTYTITVTMGDKDADATHGPMYIERGSTRLLTIPETEPGEFETGWFTINWGGGNLNLVFSGSGTNWAVNSMLIERGYKGIKIE